MQSLSPTARALLTEKFHVLLDGSDIVAANATPKQALDNLESFFLIKGRAFLREVFQERFQEYIEQTEANTPSECVDCKKKTTIEDKKPKTLISAHGEIKIKRRYHYCTPCKKYSYPVDVTLGIPKRYTNGSKRMVARCVTQTSYEIAQDNLAELCQIYLSPTTIGKVAEETAGEVEERLKTHPDVRRNFQQAKGETEFYADGAFVHILNNDDTREWREFKIGAFAKRPAGGFALPSEWATRKFPKPTAVYAFASIVNKEEFQDLCQQVRRTLGVGGVTSALGDGAKWIWNIVRAVFGKTNECLDIYHGAEHISDCGKVLITGTTERKEWFERLRMVLLSEGLSGMEREFSSLLAGKLKKSDREKIESLLEYFRHNAHRLNYAERLAQGRAIGSGLIEAACKSLVGKRLKQTGACWRLARVNRIATLCAALYSDKWEAAWKTTH